MAEGYNGAFTGGQIDEAIGRIRGKNLSADGVKFSDGETFQEKYDSGQLTGPQGETGPQGSAGAAGKSAYQSAVSGGYTGTEQAFNAALAKAGAVTTLATTFTASQWTAGSGERTITLPLLEEGASGAVVACQAAALVGGTYRTDVWAARETYAALAADGSLVLHCRESGGYTGSAVVAVWKPG